MHAGALCKFSADGLWLWTWSMAVSLRLQLMKLSALSLSILVPSDQGGRSAETSLPGDGGIGCSGGIASPHAFPTITI